MGFFTKDTTPALFMTAGDVPAGYQSCGLITSVQIGGGYKKALSKAQDELQAAAKQLGGSAIANFKVVLAENSAGPSSLIAYGDAIKKC